MQVGRYSTSKYLHRYRGTCPAYCDSEYSAAGARSRLDARRVPWPACVCASCLPCGEPWHVGGHPVPTMLRLFKACATAVSPLFPGVMLCSLTAKRRIQLRIIQFHPLRPCFTPPATATRNRNCTCKVACACLCTHHYAFIPRGRYPF